MTANVHTHVGVARRRGAIQMAPIQTVRVTTFFFSGKMQPTHILSFKSITNDIHKNEFQYSGQIMELKCISHTNVLHTKKM